MRIGELAARSGVSVRSLRYYEQQGLLSPERTAAGQRVYADQHEALVGGIQELFAAGFCSSVIRGLLPAVLDPDADRHLLDEAFAAARSRLESERSAIEGELARLAQLRERLGGAADAGAGPELFEPSVDGRRPAAERAPRDEAPQRSELRAPSSHRSAPRSGTDGSFRIGREAAALAPDAHVRAHPVVHDTSSAAAATPFDHRDRRLR